MTAKNKYDISFSFSLTHTHTHTNKHKTTDIWHLEYRNNVQNKIHIEQLEKTQMESLCFQGKCEIKRHKRDKKLKV